MNIPNLLTILRIVLVPVIVWAISQGAMGLALVIFVIAGVTDGIDGFIAKNFDQRTELGAFLDPIADKTLLVSIYVSLAIFGFIPVWLTILVVSRDVMIVGGVLLSYLIDKPLIMNPLAVSKANTAVQIVFAALILASQGLGLELGMMITFVMWTVATLTLASAAVYVRDFLRHMAT